MPKKELQFGKKAMRGKERNFIVSIASPLGGGRQEIKARNHDEAANFALANQFLSGKVPRGTSVISTDLSAPRGTESQEIFELTKTFEFTHRPLKERRVKAAKPKNKTFRRSRRRM